MIRRHDQYETENSITLTVSVLPTTATINPPEGTVTFYSGTRLFLWKELQRGQDGDDELRHTDPEGCLGHDATASLAEFEARVRAQLVDAVSDEGVQERLRYLSKPKS